MEGWSGEGKDGWEDGAVSGSHWKEPLLLQHMDARVKGGRRRGEEGVGGGHVNISALYDLLWEGESERKLDVIEKRISGVRERQIERERDRERESE
jgi:hypothetical protein